MAKKAGKTSFVTGGSIERDERPVGVTGVKDSGGVTIEVPDFAGVVSGYCRRRVDVTSLTREQAAKLKLLVHCLHQNGMETSDGYRVTREIHAFKWLLDQLPSVPTDSEK